MYIYVYVCMLIHIYMGYDNLYFVPAGVPVIEGPSEVIYRPNEGPIELTCERNTTAGSTGWRVNGGNTLSLDDIRMGGLPGHTVNGTNLVIVNATNNTQYICVSVDDVLGNTDSNPVYLYIAGTYINCINYYTMYAYDCVYMHAHNNINCDQGQVLYLLWN